MSKARRKGAGKPPMRRADGRRPKTHPRRSSARGKRQTAEHKRRSAAGRKGWRKKREEQKRRSAAAKKGWETRRASDSGKRVSAIRWAVRMRDAFARQLSKDTGATFTVKGSQRWGLKSASAWGRWKPTASYDETSNALDASGRVAQKAGASYLAIVRLWDKRIGWFTPARGLSRIQGAAGDAAENVQKRAEHYLESEGYERGEDQGGEISRIDVYVRPALKKKARRQVGVRHRN